MEISPGSAVPPCQDLLLPDLAPLPLPPSAPMSPPLQPLLLLQQKQQHFYDPFYYQRDTGGGRSGGTGAHTNKRYDDFTVSEHLHILRSHSFFLNPTASVVSVDERTSPNEAELALPGAKH